MLIIISILLGIIVLLQLNQLSINAQLFNRMQANKEEIENHIDYRMGE